MLQLVFDTSVKALGAGLCGMQINRKLETVLQKKLQVHESDQSGRFAEFDQEVKIVDLCLATRSRPQKAPDWIRQAALGDPDDQ